MFKVLSFFLLISSAYSQVFTEDISKINHAIAEGQVEEVTKFDNKVIDGAILRSLGAENYINPETNCDDDWSKYKPLNIRYELVAVTQEEPKKPDLQPQTTVIIAKFEEREHPLIADIKSMIERQVQTGNSGGTMGRFQLKQNKDAGKTVVIYSGPGTSINVNSTLKAQGVMNIDVNPLFGNTDPSTRLMTPTIQMDVVNKLSINQELGSGASLKTSLESLHTTGVRGLESLDGTKFNLSTVRAQTRIDAQLDRNVQTYSEVNFTTNTVDREIRAVAGFDISAPDNAQILVFTGYTNKSSDLAGRNPASTGISKEVGFEYRPSKRTTIYTRFSDGMDRRDRKIETGIKIQLGR